jgi:hypothetical protein
MTNADPLPNTVLSRKAVVYVRQSTQTQVQVHLESQRRQYDLVDEARRHGFRDVEVIDDDLDRSANRTVARPGFEKLVASLCAGEVGAVLCFDAFRLARNGRDWHHLLDLCGLVDARVIDLDGVYNPCRPNDRLLRSRARSDRPRVCRPRATCRNSRSCSRSSGRIRQWSASPCAGSSDHPAQRRPRAPSGSGNARS